MLLTINCIAQAAENEFPITLQYSQLKPSLLAALEGKPYSSSESTQLSDEIASLTKVTKALLDTSYIPNGCDIASKALDECINRQEDGEPVPIEIYNKILRKYLYIKLRNNGFNKTTLNLTFGAAPCFKYRCLNKGTKCCTGCNENHYCSKECQVADWKDGHKQQCKK